MALLGANGAGKSTLVGILATLVQPSTGDVRYGGRVRGRRGARAIGVVAHESLCYGDLSGRENLEFFAALYEIDGPQRRAEALLERVGLDGGRPSARHAPTRAACCSGWRWRARWCMRRGCSSSTSPSPASTAAASSGWRRLLAEERARGAILVVVTHDFDALAGLVDRVLVLERGRLRSTRRWTRAPRSDALAAAYRKAAK